MKIKSERHKNVRHKRKLKFENYKNCLEANQLVNKVKPSRKNQIDIDSLKKDLIKNS